MTERIYRRYATLRSFGEPRFRVTEFCAVVDGEQARPLALIFDVRASSGPLVGYCVEVSPGIFEACAGGVASLHASWAEAASALPAALVAPDKIDNESWEAIDCDRAAVVLHARDHGASRYAAALAVCPNATRA